jgi:prolyl-tRNA editing enzyme YbaK/EbsC (Cys-tRNA(Pro) deacylase)
MKPLQSLRSFLELHYPGTTHEEPLCTCGAGNHVRVIFFRVNHMPAAVVLPEGASLDCQHLAEALKSSSVEPITVAEMEATYTMSELGEMQPFEKPFGVTVYVDAELLAWKEFVFCPRMFSGKRGECFRVPAKSFLEETKAIALPLALEKVPDSDAWAV